MQIDKKQTSIFALTLVGLGLLCYQVYQMVTNDIEDRPYLEVSQPMSSGESLRSSSSTSNAYVPTKKKSLPHAQKEYIEMVNQYELAKLKRQLLEEEAAIAAARKRIIELNNETAVLQRESVSTLPAQLMPPVAKPVLPATPKTTIKTVTPAVAPKVDAKALAAAAQKAALEAAEEAARQAALDKARREREARLALLKKQKADRELAKRLGLPDIQLHVRVPKESSWVERPTSPPNHERLISRLQSGDADLSAAKPKKIILSKNNRATVLSMPANHYTIQLISSYRSDVISGYLAKNDLQRDVQQFSIPRRGRSWHVVIYGNYETFKDAQRALRHMSANMKVRGPYVRRYSDIQKRLR